jgi:hypothetical protein
MKAIHSDEEWNIWNILCEYSVRKEHLVISVCPDPGGDPTHQLT